MNKTGGLFCKNRASEKALLYLFLCVVTSSIVFAVPPINSVFVGQNGYQIETPAIATIQQGNQFKLQIHVFNLSNGVPLNNSISCYMHLYNQSGNHILIMETKETEHNFDFEFEIGGGNFSNVGYYAYIAQCNGTTGGGGFVSNYLDVTPDGLEGSPTKTGLRDISIVVGMILVMASLILFAYFFKKEQPFFGIVHLKHIFFIIAYVFMLFVINFLSDLLDRMGLIKESALLKDLNIILIIVFGIGILIIGILYGAELAEKLISYIKYKE